MSRRKHKKPAPAQRRRAEGPQAFNPALARQLRLGPAEPEPIDIQPPKEPPAEDDEMAAFRAAMGDVVPMADGKERYVADPDPQLRAPHTQRDEDLEALMHLTDLVGGVAEMDITFSDEYIEGAVHGFSPRLLHKLKRGDFPVQDYIDLHGLTQAEAEQQVRRFLIQSYNQGFRCVLVVHGRGLNSANNIPVLKERIPVWLSRGTVRRIVLAFSTARPYDGGTGAIYVLLRARGRVLMT